MYVCMCSGVARIKFSREANVGVANIDDVKGWRVGRDNEGRIMGWIIGVKPDQWRSQGVTWVHDCTSPSQLEIVFKS